jgi:hypothetical protein
LRILSQVRIFMALPVALCRQRRCCKRPTLSLFRNIGENVNEART